MSHAAVGKAHMRTSLDMYTLCAHECFEEEWPRPVAEEGSGVSHAAVGRAHMRTCIHMDACLDVCM